tara:strand:+ start:234 stop:701 length:468 start_codon:yes stop_codon:yes gene_type:complete
MANGRDNLDEQDRRLFTAITSRMSYDSRIFNQRIRKEIDRLRRAGLDEQSIIRVLSQDLESNGRIFGELRNAIKYGIVGGINQAFRRAGKMGQSLRWVAISKNPCDDCISVAGKVDTWEGWERRGMPGSGWSICKDHCYCQLVPDDMDIDDTILL